MTRRALTTIIAMAAAAVLAACGSTTADDPGRAPATPAAAPPAATRPPACPATPVDPERLEGADRLPPGAYAVRLCPGPGTGNAATRDALTEGVDELVATVNGLEPLPRRALCTDEIGPGYSLVFGYDDHGRVSTRAVTGELYGCRTVRIGSGTAAGAERPLATYVRLLTAQRRHQSPPAGATSGWRPCQENDKLGQQRSLIGEPTEVVRAAACRPGRDPHPAELAAADLSTLLTDLEQADFRPYSTTRVRHLPRAVSLRCSPTWEITGITAWGDLVRLPVECDGMTGPPYWARDTDPLGLAPMSPEVQRIVQRYVKAAR